MSEDNLLSILRLDEILHDTVRWRCHSIDYDPSTACERYGVLRSISEMSDCSCISLSLTQEVSGIDEVDAKRPNTMHLNDGFSLRPSEVRHAFRDEDEIARAERAQFAAVEPCPGCKVPNALKNDYVLILRVGVGYDDEIVFVSDSDYIRRPSDLRITKDSFDDDTGSTKRYDDVMG